MTFNTYGRWAMFILRIELGWLMFYAGITKVLDPEWSAEGYLTHATTFPEFFAGFARPELLPITNFLNEWGITLVGISLLFGALTRLGAFFGGILMLLYYIPTLDFPYPNEHTFLIDDHLIYLGLFMLIAAVGAGKFIGVDGLLAKRPFVQQRKWLKRIIE